MYPDLTWNHCLGYCWCCVAIDRQWLGKVECYLSEADRTAVDGESGFLQPVMTFLFFFIFILGFCILLRLLYQGY
jgi:hypothetical protein